MASIKIINTTGSVPQGPLTIPMLTCSTAVGTAAKTCSNTNPNFKGSLVAGTHILLKLTNGNSAASPTLSINSGTAISITGDGSAKPAQFNYANAVMHLVYDGTNWVIVG